MNIDTNRPENYAITLRPPQTDRDCLSQDFTQDRKRAQSELARAANEKQKPLVSITRWFLYGVFAIGFFVLVFQVVKHFFE